MSFKVRGPYTLAVRYLADKPSGLRVRVVNASKSFKKLKDSKTSSPKGGVYIFAVRKERGPGSPWYVGKTEGKKLVNEALQPEKLGKYAQALAETGIGV